jgi:histidinol-phosphate aminotransferase
MDLNDLIRPNIRKLRPYATARHEYGGEARVFLDVNENPFDTGLNRYPDPLQRALKQRVGELKGLPPENIFLGNGSDEAIELLLRIFCEPGRDHIITLPPTYGMYRVAADIHGAEVVEMPLNASFQPPVEAILQQADAHSKLLFLCSPNNPTGNAVEAPRVEALLRDFPGIVVVDEAYADFSGRPSWTRRLTGFQNLVVLQTFSKAWGLAGIRLGMAFAAAPLIELFNKMKPPYNLNQLTQEKALEALARPERMQQQRQALLNQRTIVQHWLMGLDIMERVYPSEANFLLVKVADADALYDYLAQQGIIVRNRSRMPGCAGCLRITIGTPEENEELFQALVRYHPETTTSQP